MEQTHIDELLERYLGLLDEYSRLRQELSRLQSGVYQNIARANFAGERGMRYGQDHYDERMQALRRLDIEAREPGVPVFTIRNATTASSSDVSPEVDESVEEHHGLSVKTVPNPKYIPHGPTALRNAYAKYGAPIPKELDDAVAAHEEKLAKHDATSENRNVDDGANNEEEPSGTNDNIDENKSAEPKGKKKPSNNPLHWFGLFAPSALRTAQTQSVEAVEQVIPRLVSVNAEMENIEIEVRRARKRRAKAELAAEKEATAAGTT